MPQPKLILSLDQLQRLFSRLEPPTTGDETRELVNLPLDDGRTARVSLHWTGERWELWADQVVITA